MKLTQKFAFTAAALTALAGCTNTPSSEGKMSTGENSHVYPESCVVVVKNGKPLDHLVNVYDFRDGLLMVSGAVALVAVPLRDLNKSGQERAMEAYKNLPASANCEAPVLKP